MTDTPLAVFRRLTNGVYVVGVAHDGRHNGFTAAWVTQVSFDPLLVALSINPEHASFPLLKAGGGFTVNVLRKDQVELAGRFGTHTGRDTDKLAQVRWRPGRSGAPVLLDALACLECRLTGSLPAGDHEIVLGQVFAGTVFAEEASPLVYADTANLDGSAELYPARF